MACSSSFAKLGLQVPELDRGEHEGVQRRGLQAAAGGREEAQARLLQPGQQPGQGHQVGHREMTLVFERPVALMVIATAVLDEGAILEVDEGGGMVV